MLTLEHNERKYKWNGNLFGTLDINNLMMDERLGYEVWVENMGNWIRTFHTPEQLVSLGYMEEIKPLSQKRAEAIERGEEVAIIEKLREELERRIKFVGATEEDEFVKGCRCALDVLTSLQSPLVKEEPQETYKGFVQCMKNDIELQEEIAKGPDTLTEKLERSKNWQPTPGEMIEVSNDGEKWKPATFDKILDNSQHNIGTKEGYAYLFARPLPQEDIELLPDYQLRTQDNGRHRMTPSHEEKQIILLTETVNKIIQANKK